MTNDQALAGHGPVQFELQAVAQKHCVLVEVHLLAASFHAKEGLRERAQLDASVVAKFGAPRPRVDLESRPVARVEVTDGAIQNQPRERHQQTGLVRSVDRPLAHILVVVHEIFGDVARHEQPADVEPHVGLGLNGHREVALRRRVDGLVEHVGIDARVGERDGRRERKRTNVDPRLRRRILHRLSESRRRDQAQQRYQEKLMPHATRRSKRHTQPWNGVVRKRERGRERRARQRPGPESRDFSATGWRCSGSQRRSGRRCPPCQQ